MSGTSTDDEDGTASEHSTDSEDGNTSDESRRSRARRVRWTTATGEHWLGNAATTETQARRDAEIERDRLSTDDEVAREHWDDDGGPNLPPHPPRTRSHSPHPIAHFPPL
jgi:hypothetical protein